MIFGRGDVTTQAMVSKLATLRYLCKCAAAKQVAADAKMAMRPIAFRREGATPHTFVKHYF